MKRPCKIKTYAMILAILVTIPLKSQGLIDCIMGNGSCSSGRVPLLPFVEANDSISRLYISALMNYIDIEAVDLTYSGYTTAKVRESMRIGTDFNNDQSRYVPKGVIAMYLIYTIILKDSAFCDKIVITRKHRGKTQSVAFYELPTGKINESSFVGEFIGRRQLKKIVKIFKKWYEANSNKSMLDLKQNLPFNRTAYNFRGL
jgi:hypothetical protein